MHSKDPEKAPHIPPPLMDLESGKNGNIIGRLFFCDLPSTPLAHTGGERVTDGNRMVASGGMPRAFSGLDARLNLSESPTLGFLCAEEVPKASC